MNLPALRDGFDPDQARADLEEFGLYRLRGVLTQDLLRATLDRRLAVARTEDETGSAYRYDGAPGLRESARPNQRV